MNELRPFYIKLALYTALIGLVYYASGSVRPSILTHEWFPFMVILFAVLTAMFHVGLVRAGSKGNQAFIRYYMAATTFKLFILMSVIIVYAFFIELDTRSFIIIFFLLYVIYTSFEVSYVYRKLSSMKASQQDKVPDESSKD
jgi:hypothetical protein